MPVSAVGGAEPASVVWVEPRVQLRIESGDVALNTRKGLDWADRFPEIAKEGRGLPDAVIACE